MPRFQPATFEWPSTLTEFIDTAKAQQGFKSDAELSRALGLTDSVVSQWRRGLSVPSDEVLIELALLGYIDPCVALVAANLWKPAKEGLRKYYELLWMRVARALLILGAASLITPADAGHTENKSASALPSLYIMRYLRRLLGRCRGWLRRVSGGARQPSRTESARAAAAYSAVCRRVAACRDWRPRVMP